jgi:5'(3')-deoxyribonucleotidase
MKKRIILVDCDGVLANCTKTFVQACNAANGTSFTVEDAGDGWDVARTLGLDATQAARMWERMNCPLVATLMEPLPGAIAGVRKLLECQDLQVAVCTAPMRTSPTWAHDRRAWIHEHLGDVPVISTHDKWLCRGDFLIDDSYDNARTWVDQGPAGAQAIWWVPKANRPIPPRTEVHQDWDRVLLSCVL